MWELGLFINCPFFRNAISYHSNDKEIQCVTVRKQASRQSEIFNKTILPSSKQLINHRCTIDSCWQEARINAKIKHM